MRTLVLVLLMAVVLVVSRAQAQRVFTDRAEFERQKAEYDRQKARYDEFQTLSKVPLLASYDLIPKGKDAEAAPGRAEQLLPNYTGESVKFQEPRPAVVESGNTPQNYFHKGPIPAKKSSGRAPPRPVVIPRGPGQEFVVPQDDAAAAPAAITTSSAEGPTASALTPFAATARAIPPTPFATPAPSAPAQHALFFAPGALPASPAAFFVQADAPVQASSGLPSPVPVRPLGREFLFAPALPNSDFRPGPARPVSSYQADAPDAVLRIQPAAIYGPPARFG